MADNPFVAQNSIDRAALAQTNQEVMGGANWFWWIAGLSLVNTVINHSGGDTNFVIGLGFTQVADALFRENLPVLALIIDALAIGTIFALGWYSRRGYRWAFLTGIILYVIDALIYLVFGDMMSLGFHCFALFFIIRGALQLHQLIKQAEAAPASTPTDLPPVLPS